MGLKINIGCGSRFHRDWLNLDLHSHAPEVVACDLTQGIPVADGEADVVYAAAVLEHIRSRDVSGFLAECRRTLKPGGVLRLAVPDLEQQAQFYLDSLARIDEGETAAASDREWMVLEMLDQSTREETGGEMLRFLMQREIPNQEFIVKRIGVEGDDLIKQISTWKGKKVPHRKKPSLYDMVPLGRYGRALLKWLLHSKNLEQDLRALEIGRFRLNSGEVHQWAYDRYSLAKILLEAGFTEPKKCAHGESRIPEWKSFHLEVTPEGVVEKPDLLVMEAVK
jgi:predicted SAM-dependent methyltransferase